MRRIPLSRRSHVIGFQALTTGVAEHESALERDFVTLVSFADAGAVVTAQPITIWFEHEGRRRRYTPDFRVDWTEGGIEIVEIKYRADLRTNWARLRPAFEAARRWTVANGARFRISTERGIRGCRLEAAKRLLPLRSTAIDSVLAEQVMVHVREAPSFGELVGKLPVPLEAALGVVWRLIARGELTVDLDAPITPSTRVTAR
ncbi:TnsA endonuclease N-terminal domain-containing protein [Roseiarcaceae bacterium H3SJ34-1]|uniref:TnsA endonuclease N-terminal domain-containing protein n=1 Tax=Terripilifer ovatus TaxID=3032367 RepID=UPI003AB987A7|nr:TnsA endonuclease N-terminal domain-containing protein [Roseiarcaceae bacterium H3SJ34-1]